MSIPSPTPTSPQPLPEVSFVFGIVTGGIVLVCLFCTFFVCSQRHIRKVTPEPEAGPLVDDDPPPYSS